MASKVDKNQVLLYFCNTLSESSSVGRAQPCQGWGREFESRLSLQIKSFQLLEAFVILRYGCYLLSTYSSFNPHRIKLGVKNEIIPNHIHSAPAIIKALATPMLSAIFPANNNPIKLGMIAKLKYKENTRPNISGAISS